MTTTKRNVKTLLLLFSIGVFTISCSTSNKATKYWKGVNDKIYNNRSEYMNFNVKTERFSDDGTLDLSYFLNHYIKRQFSKEQLDWYVVTLKKSSSGKENAYYWNGDTIIHIDYTNGEVITTTSNDTTQYSWEAGLFFQELMNYWNFIVPYSKTYCGDNWIGFKKKKINNKTYRVLTYPNTMVYADDSVGNSILDEYNVDIYVNDSSKMIEWIEKFLPNPNKTFKYTFSDISYTANDSIVKEIFDLNNNATFTKIMNIDYGSPNRTRLNKESFLTDTVLNYPLINSYGDTTTIGKETGWLLLDFWFFGCKPCIEFFNTINTEEKQYGKSILEQNNVKILSINPFTSNYLALKQQAEKYNFIEHVYCAKDLRLYFNIRGYPSFFLISPDKKIVYDSNDLGDYSEILEIIKQYKR
ncbi:MAG: thioredoxin family protein [Bacteroidales bacterium]|jgi:thiol-disulfide isomerase/thioredoxin|nr:thioredoxin family protein [Bacteroidales bacterium]